MRPIATDSRAAERVERFWISEMKRVIQMPLQDSAITRSRERSPAQVIIPTSAATGMLRAITSAPPSVMVKAVSRCLGSRVSASVAPQALIPATIATSTASSIRRHSSFTARRTSTATGMASTRAFSTIRRGKKTISCSREAACCTSEVIAIEVSVPTIEMSTREAASSAVNTSCTRSSGRWTRRAWESVRVVGASDWVAISFWGTARTHGSVVVHVFVEPGFPIGNMLVETP